MVRTKKNNNVLKISFLKNSDKLVDLDKLKNIYEKTLKYLKKMNEKDYDEVIKLISKKKVDNNKILILQSIFSNLRIDRTKNKIYNENFKLKDKNNCFKDFKKINVLGQGIAGITHLVEKDNKQYALKEQSILLNMFNPIKKEQIDRIKNEIILSKKMGDKNIGPKIYDYYICVENNTTKVLILMEYMNGGTLKSWHEKNQFTKKHEEEIESKIKKLHNEGIIHNDLHLDNIFVKETNGKVEFFIGDFGFGQTSERLIEGNKLNDTITFTHHLGRIDDDKYMNTILKLLIMNNFI